ncbi:MAG: hypothetical protein JWO36_1807 [Myxococcales bacterium]|nr:hypothetical protein [Myxococcales bacterium]
MRRSVALVAIGVGFAAVASAALSQQEINALSPIDSVPLKVTLDSVFNGAPQARDQLVAIAQDANGDIGVRLRAIHTLWKYCPFSTSPSMSPGPCITTDPGWPVHLALVAMVPASPAAWPHSGADLLLLRAAIESLGLLKVSTDVDLLTPLLDHPSRDIRATAARALRDLCNPQATNPLRVRYAHENLDQVRLAISDALRVLAAGCP